MLGVGGNSVREQLREAEVLVGHHTDRHQRCATQQQPGLDDLHPGCGLHAAEGDVGDDQRADDDDGQLVGHLRYQGMQQLPGTHRLADQIPDHDDQRTDRRHGADRALAEAERDDVAVGEFAQIAQPFCDQEQDDRPANQPPHRKDQAIEAVHVDQRCDTQERCRRHVVAGNGHAVLQAGNTASGGVKVGRRLGPGRRPVGDDQRDSNEDQEHHDGVPIDGHFCRYNSDCRHNGSRRDIGGVRQIGC